MSWSAQRIGETRGSTSCHAGSSSGVPAQRRNGAAGAAAPSAFGMRSCAGTHARSGSSTPAAGHAPGTGPPMRVQSTSRRAEEQLGGEPPSTLQLVVAPLLRTRRRSAPAGTRRGFADDARMTSPISCLAFGAPLPAIFVRSQTTGRAAFRFVVPTRSFPALAALGGDPGDLFVAEVAIDQAAKRRRVH